MKWKMPPKIKIYEALGAIADDRVELNGETARVESSDGSKKYDVIYSNVDNSIMSNDNGSYWQGYLGYPSIAFLMIRNKLDYNNEYANALRNIKWKQINVRNNNDFAKTINEIDKIIEQKGINLKKFEKYITSVRDQISALELNYFGKKIKPPK